MLMMLMETNCYNDGYVYKQECDNCPRGYLLIGLTNERLLTKFVALSRILLGESKTVYAFGGLWNPRGGHLKHADTES